MSSDPQPDLWARACARSAAADPSLRGEEIDVERATIQKTCEKDFDGYPRAVANRSAKCFLELEPQHGPNVPEEFWRPCIGESAEAYFDKRAKSFQLVREAYKTLSDNAGLAMPSERPSPRAVADALRGRVGAWGDPPTVLDNGKDSWHLCDPGPDRQLRTHDDLCSAAPFIYFQF